MIETPPTIRPRWRLNIPSVVAALIILIGLGIFSYPATAAWFSQYSQSRAIDAYTNLIRTDPPPGNSERLAAAHAYNDQLNAGEVVLGSDAHKPEASGEEESSALPYHEILNLGDGFMGRLKIPSISVDLPIYHGTTDEVLEKGVGHLEGTSLPVGGIDTHSVLTAHRGLASATLFNDLNKLEPGDTFVIEVSGDILTYRVFDTQVVEPSDTKTLATRPGQDVVTLVTCTPLGINSHRILVTGERVTPTPTSDMAAGGQSPDIPGFPWWAVLLGGGVGVCALFIWRSGYPPKRRASGLTATMSTTAQ